MQRETTEEQKIHRWINRVPLGSLHDSDHWPLKASIKRSTTPVRHLWGKTVWREIQKYTHITGWPNARLAAWLYQYIKTHVIKSKIKQWLTAANGLKIFINNIQTPLQEPHGFSMLTLSAAAVSSKLSIHVPQASSLMTPLSLYWVPPACIHPLAAIARHSSQPCVNRALFQIHPELPRPQPRSDWLPLSSCKTGLNMH